MSENVDLTGHRNTMMTSVEEENRKQLNKIKNEIKMTNLLIPVFMSLYLIVKLITCDIYSIVCKDFL